jgi:hypothetical protein
VLARLHLGGGARRDRDPSTCIGTCYGTRHGLTLFHTARM